MRARASSGPLGRREAANWLMARWRTIPVSRQKPGKLMGGFWVVIQAYAVANHWTVAMLGEDGAKVTGGYGDWDVIDRPRSVGITEWRGENNMEMSLDLLYDGWTAHPVFPRLPAAFIGPPKLPSGVQYQSRRTGKPIGAVVRTGVKRPLAPASKPPKAAVATKRPIPPASRPPNPTVATNRPIPPRPKPPGQLGGAMAAPRVRVPAPRRVVRPGTQLVAPRTRTPPPRRTTSSRGVMPAPQTRRPAPIRRRSSARPQAVWLEAMLEGLESLALCQPGDNSPHSVRLYGAVPHSEKRWVIQSLDWGDCIRDRATGRRTRQQVTVHLLEYHQPAALRRLPRGKAEKPTSKPVQAPRSR